MNLRSHTVFCVIPSCSKVFCFILQPIVCIVCSTWRKAEGVHKKVKDLIEVCDQSRTRSIIIFGGVNEAKHEVCQCLSITENSITHIVVESSKTTSGPSWKKLCGT